MWPNPEMSCRKGVKQILAKFKGKHLCQSLFFNRPATLFKKEALAQVFSCEFAKFLIAPFLTEQLPWLLLYMEKAAGILCIITSQFHIPATSYHDHPPFSIIWNNAMYGLYYHICIIMLHIRYVSPYMVI